MHTLLGAVAALAGHAAAFYPYNNRLPLQRVPVQRDNKFNVVQAAQPSQANSAGVNQDGTDFVYFSSISFGDGKQTFNMLVDSGASNTWVMSSDCKSDVCNAHNTFGTEDSSTLKATSDTFSITYGTGSVQGVIGSDTAHFAGMSVPLTFGLGQNVSQEFSSYPMDGIVGLGRGDSTEPAINAPTFMDALKSAGAIESKLYALSLWRDSDGGTNNGEISFGSPDTSKFSGSLAYVATKDNSDGFWEIPIGDASVDGKSLGISQRSALVDSGTSFILMPPDDALKLHAQIEGSEQDGERFTIPCDWEGTVSITFGGVKYDISYKDVVLSSNGQCISNIVGRQTFSPDQWLVGDVFLKNVYAVFDFDGNRVGFAEKVDSSRASSSSPTSTKAPLSAPGMTTAASDTTDSASSDASSTAAGTSTGSAAASITDASAPDSTGGGGAATATPSGMNASQSNDGARLTARLAGLLALAVALV